jgi:hypothetical protein
MSAIQLQDWIDKSIRGVIIKGALLRKYDTPEDLCLLDQDILEVELPNGIYIDVGWFPQHDANGRFVIRAYREHRRQPLREPIETREPFDVAKFVVDLVSTYASPRPPRAIPISRSSSIRLDYNPRHAQGIAV